MREREMERPKATIEGVSIVLLGSFNPAIFQPAWFAAQKLIPEKEAVDVEMELVHNEVSAFSVGWLNLQVLRDRFTASAVQPPSFDVLRDFVLGTFSILRHTPITMVGLNFERHYDMENETAWHDLGKKLAPPDPWEPALSTPGMRSLMMEGTRNDGNEGY